MNTMHYSLTNALEIESTADTRPPLRRSVKQMLMSLILAVALLPLGVQACYTLAEIAEAELRLVAAVADSTVAGIALGEALLTRNATIIAVAAANVARTSAEYAEAALVVEERVANACCLQ